MRSDRSGSSLHVRSRRACAAGVMLLAAAAVGCSAEADADAQLALDLPAFTPGDAPALVLEDDGTPEKAFARISARRMPDGTIAVADQGVSAIHLFGRDGALIRTLARRGKGPGELEGSFGFAAHADTLFTFGWPPMSAPGVNTFTASGGFLSHHLPRAANARLVTALHRLSTGEYVVQRGSVMRVIDELPEPGSLLPDSIEYGILRAGGAAAEDAVWLGPTLRGWMFAFRFSDAPFPMTGGYRIGPTTSMVVSGDRLWLVDGGSGLLRAFDGSGREVVRRELSLERRPYDPARLERAREAAVAAAASALDTARADALYDPALLPPAMPLVSTAVAGPDGEVWLRLFDLDDAAPQRFLVVDRDGSEIAQAVLPAGLQVEHVGRDFVLGVRRDELGVESVVEYALARE